VSKKKCLDTQEKTGETALYWACLGGGAHGLVVRQLLEAKADANIPNKEGDTPIIAAAGQNQVENIKTLLLWGHADPNHKNNLGHTALNVSYHKDHKESMKMLKNETAVEEDPALGGFVATDGRGAAAFVSTFSTDGVGKPQRAHK